jgi:hypothetical protein
MSIYVSFVSVLESLKTISHVIILVSKFIRKDSSNSLYNHEQVDCRSRGRSLQTNTEYNFQSVVPVKGVSERAATDLTCYSY